MVKIDKQFVAGMLHDPRSMAVVQALVGLGKALALDVVAEGVESLEEARRCSGSAASSARASCGVAPFHPSASCASSPPPTRNLAPARGWSRQPARPC